MCITLWFACVFFLSLQTTIQWTSLQVYLTTCVISSRVNTLKWNCWAKANVLFQYHLLSTLSIPVRIPILRMWVPFSSHSHQFSVFLDVYLLPLLYVKHHDTGTLICMTLITSEAHISFFQILLVHTKSFILKVSKWNLPSELASRNTGVKALCLPSRLRMEKWQAGGSQGGLPGTY